MATKVLVKGKFETRPGVYSTIVSGIRNPTPVQSFSNILIIDDGIGAGFGGGSGINGTLQNGDNAVYEFDSLQAFRGFVKGGELWNLAAPLFNPSKKFSGVSKIYLVQAKSTTPADITLNLTNGTFQIQPKDEGLNANGVLAGSMLSLGYASKLLRTNTPTNTATFITTVTQAPAPAVAETRASTTFTVPAPGADGTVYTVETVAGGGLVIASFTKTSAENTATLLATALRAASPLAGWNLSGATTSLTVKPPIGTGDNYNTQIISIKANGVDTVTDTIAGGVDAVAAKPKITKATALNINVEDSFTVTASTITKTVKASSTLPGSLYNSLAALFNADTAFSATSVASITPSGLVITGQPNVTFSQTSSSTPAPAKFKFQIWHGTYKGLDPINNIAYDNVAVADATPLLVIESPVVTSLTDLISWFNTSGEFNNGFNLLPGYVASGDIVVADLTTYPSWILASNATESYSNNDFDSAISKINNVDFTHILSTQYGLNATALNNTKLFDFVNNDSKFDRLLVVAGGYDKSSFKFGNGSSAVTSAFYNSDKVIVVHGGCKKKLGNAAGFVTYSQLYKAATILGRCAGLEPQVPVTLKSIGIDAEVHSLDDSEQEFAIAKGIMYSYYDYEFKTFVAGLDINSLQQNEFLINDDGSTYNWALKRIEAALNKTIVVGGKLRFFGDNAGGNRNTTSVEEVVVWAKSKLDEQVASDKNDNLIIRYQEVAASIDQDNLNLTYKFVGNTEISKIISTGTIIAG